MATEKKENEKPPRCPWCGKPFKTKNETIKHMAKCPDKPATRKGGKA